MTALLLQKADKRWRLLEAIVCQCGDSGYASRQLVHPRSLVFVDALRPTCPTEMVSNEVHKYISEGNKKSAKMK